MKLNSILITTLLLFGTASYVESYKILGLFPFMAKSHFIVGNSLMKGLAKAGHEVTVVSAFPNKGPIDNYTFIDVSEILEAMKSKMSSLLDMPDLGILEIISDIYDMGIFITNHTMNNPKVKTLIASDQKFDVIIVEIFLSEALIGFGHHFKAPVIGISTFGASKWTNDLVGTPSPLSYIPHPFLSFTDQMNFVQRLGNTMMNLFETIYMNLFYYPHQREIYEASFPDPKPTLDEIMKKVNLVLLNNHFSLSHPRPYPPAMIEVGGMHINRKPKPLPAHIQSYLDNATDGVIYFSMGSNIQCKTLPVEKRDALLKTFATFKQKVMWKWEEDNLPGKSENVFISSWWPQDDILAHPNVKVFITHGGLLSTSESIYHGVPVVGIPIFGDQELNMARAARAEYGLTVSYKNLTQKALTWALNEILTDPKYTKNVKIISERYRDQQNNPLDTAIYWVEYVARHKGAPHLRIRANDLSFIEYHNLDVFATILAVILAVFWFIWFIIKSLIRCMCGGSQTSSTSEIKNKNKNIKRKIQ
jgi:hypothetical protein